MIFRARSARRKQFLIGTLVLCGCLTHGNHAPANANLISNLLFSVGQMHDTAYIWLTPRLIFPLAAPGFPPTRPGFPPTRPGYDVARRAWTSIEVSDTYPWREVPRRLEMEDLFLSRDHPGGQLSEYMKCGHEADHSDSGGLPVVDALATSGDRKHLAAILRVTRGSRFTHRLLQVLPGLGARPRYDCELWVSHLDGSSPHRIGLVLMDVPASPENKLCTALQWSDGDAHISFIHDGWMYMAPTRSAR